MADLEEMKMAIAFIVGVVFGIVFALVAAYQIGAWHQGRKERHIRAWVRSLPEETKLFYARRLSENMPMTEEYKARLNEAIEQRERALNKRDGA